MDLNKEREIHLRSNKFKSRLNRKRNEKHVISSEFLYIHIVFIFWLKSFERSKL